MTGCNEESASKIRVDDNGDRVLGGSLRADGSVRKTIKVRPGYTPKEDIKRYDVKERMRQKQEEKEKTINEKSEEVRKPGSRPTKQFRDINNILQSNSPTTHKPSPELRTTKKQINCTTSDLESSLGRLHLGSSDRKETPPSPTSSTTVEKSPTSTKPKRYIPPSQRKRYTIADLDKQ